MSPSLAMNGDSTPNITTAYSGWGRVWCSAPVPLTRVAANGKRYMRISSIGLWGGSGGTIQLFVANDNGSGEGATGGFGSVQSGGWGTGQKGMLKYFDNIQSGWWMRYGFIHGGTLYYGRHNISGREIRSNGGLEWSGAALSGSLFYAEVPEAPDTPTAEKLSDGRVRVRFSGNGNGGGSITGWKLQYDDNPSFSSPTTINSSGTSDLTLEPGKTWYFRAAGRNVVSDHAGTYGPWSGTRSFFVSGGGKRKEASGWKSFNTFERLTGPGTSVELTIKKRFTGTQWVDLTN